METMIYGIINFFIYLIHRSDLSVYASISPRGWREWTAFKPESPSGRQLLPGATRERNGNPLQYSCLENSMDRGSWQATVHGVAKSRTQLSDSHTHIHTHTHTL